MSVNFDAGKATVGVAFGGPSDEHDVSVLTGLQALHELHSAGRKVLGIYWSKPGDFYGVSPTLEAMAFRDGVPREADLLLLEVGPKGGFVSRSRLGRKRIPVDVIVNCCHGGPGEDGTLQAILEMAGLGFTGQGVAGSALSMDKLAFHGVVASAGMPVLPRVLLRSESEEPGRGALGREDVPFGPPYIVKPRFGGSSIGVEVVVDLVTAHARAKVSPYLQRGAVLEPYRPDLVDLNVAVRCFPAIEVSAVERPIRQSDSEEILSYEDKYSGREGMASAPRELPANVDVQVRNDITGISRSLIDLVALRGITRVDFLWGEGELYLNEVNSIPGSLARYLWIDPERKFIELLDDMVSEALASPAVTYSASGADGSVLEKASSMASKLS
ncbi:MAG: D-alanine--D-alanine ligase family protein [Acidimicrobiales bacterium]